MTLACPECGAAAPPDARAGKAYACPGCRNPVLPASVEPPRAAPAGAPAAVAAPAAPAHHAAWRTGLIAFVVLGAAYVGAYELLSAEAKRERAQLVRLHGLELTTFPDPGPQPPPDDAKALRDYLPARERWLVRTRYAALGTRIDVMFTGMLGAFALQSVVTAAIAIRTWRKGKPAGASRPA